MGERGCPQPILFSHLHLIPFSRGKWHSRFPKGDTSAAFSLLFTDLIPSDQRVPLPPLAGRRGNYIIYIGNGQDSMGTSSLCLIRENQVTAMPPWCLRLGSDSSGTHRLGKSARCGAGVAHPAPLLP